MSRLLTLVIPICLAIIACASPPSGRGAAMEADFSLDALRVAPVADAGSAAGAAADGAANATGTVSVTNAPSAMRANTETVASEVALAGPTQDRTLPDDTRHLTVLLGQRMLDDDDWEPVDEQVAVGIEVDATDRDTGHGYEFGMAFSRDDDDIGAFDVEGNTLDLYGGYRHTFQPDSGDFHPYVSAGLALIRGEVEIDGPGPDFSDDDASPGAYVRAGVGFDLQEGTRLGIDYRHLFLSDMDLGSIGDADFDQLMLTLGFAF